MRGPVRPQVVWQGDWLGHSPKGSLARKAHDRWVSVGVDEKPFEGRFMCSLVSIEMNKNHYRFGPKRSRS